MATITAKNGFIYDPKYLDLNAIYEAYSYVASSSVFRANYGYGSSDTFRGYGFTYNQIGEPVAGVVTSYQAAIFGKVALTITNISVSASDLVRVAHSAGNSDDQSLIRANLAGNDAINGGSDRDVIYGYGGNDTLRGNAGDDIMNGGLGNDLITGGLGRDLLSGAAGNDRFIFLKASESTIEARDVVKDFKRGADKIDLSKIDADAEVAGNQAFKYLGAHDFTGRDGELRFYGGSVYGDLNGDGVADFAVRVAGPASLSAVDFIL